LFSQIVADTFNIPNYPIPEIYYTDEAPELPDNVWNHKLDYFPDSMINQIGATCGQASGVFNCLTYMFNRAYDRKSDSSNIFPPNFTYNYCSKFYGLSTFDSWNIIKSQGHPSQLEFETNNNNTNITNSEFNYSIYGDYWMNGYENYHKSFSNRIIGYYSLDVKTENDLNLLKHYLNDGFDKNPKGGVAIFYTYPFSCSFTPHRFRMPELHMGYYSNYNLCCAFDQIEMSHIPSHSMTLTGYLKNDSVDFNGDGIISDSIDINNDNIIDFQDNEKILWIITNSYGPGPIFLLKYDAICKLWNQQVFFPIPDIEYSPEITFKIKLKHAERGDIKISAGISSDIESDIPEIEIDFPVFNFQGGDVCMTGVDSLAESDLLEFGIDISNLKNYISNSDIYKVFMRIENEGNTSGELQYFSIIDYSNDDKKEYKIISTPTSIPMASSNYFCNNIFINPNDFNEHIQITNSNKLAASPNQTINIPILTNFGQTPFEYFIFNTNEYDITTSYKQFPSDEGYTYDSVDSKTINPDWNIMFANKKWDSIIIWNTGKLDFLPVSFVNDSNELYPYQSTIPIERKIDISPFEIDKLNSYRHYFATQTNENYFEVFIKKERWNNTSISYTSNDETYTQITKDGKIEIIYSDTVPDYKMFANIKTDMRKYYIPYAKTTLDTFNTITFTPNPVDSLFTIDANGILTMQPVSEPGIYETYVLVRDANGQEFTKRIEINVINENIIGNLYPNPTKDILYCDIYNPKEQNSTIEIFNITGQIVYKKTSVLTEGINKHSFNTNQFRQGVYFLKISLGHVSQTQRFMVIK